MAVVRNEESQVRASLSLREKLQEQIAQSMKAIESETQTSNLISIIKKEMHLFENGGNRGHNLELMETHNKNLILLRRVCGYLVGKKKYPIGTNQRNKIEKVFYVLLSDEIENVHPSNICHKCYDTINNVIKRMASTTLLLNMNWKPHSDKCYCCQQAEKLSKGVNFTKSRKMNKRLIGCPVHQAGVCEKVHDSEINVEELKNEFNPHLQLCQCNLCGKIPKQPVTLKKCEHLFCFFLFSRRYKGKPSEDNIMSKM
ncbi:V(D)J recombination-activating protein 1-like [Hydra vulgaris]|uniref:V(D)J recombination-activating protein 1-like n=1 Tax=Hydra vulgaris TaxID=6087 RepID=UPI0032E9DC41